jgi:hypothetical protein
MSSFSHSEAGGKILFTFGGKVRVCRQSQSKSMQILMLEFSKDFCKDFCKDLATIFQRSCKDFEKIFAKI